MTSSPNRLVALVMGTGYLLFGLGGFAASWGADFLAPHGGLLLGVQVNGLHNLVHLAVGAALLVCGLSSVGVARTGNALIGTLVLLFALVGLFLIGSPANVFALNGAGNVLHSGTAVVLLAVGLGADRPDSQKRGTEAATPTR
ncbi:DUF4383 domain-containing protein [Conyzicola sp.]|uniref:DUF4383 domain-containing protein n=1 Tax=Conyzicola sp. TaxID=1969404 RepID=UPI003988EFF3